jgi:chemotaxis protein CheX
VGKYVLIVEPEEGKLSAIAPALKDLDFVVLRAATSSVAQELVSSTPLLSLVAIDGSIGRDEGAELVSALKSEHQELPILWAANQELNAPLSQSRYLPDALVTPPFDAKDLHEVVQRLLMAHLYPEPVVAALVQASIGSLAEAYHAKLQVAGMHMRANRHPLAEVNAILPFVGKHICGRAVVGATAADLLRIRANVVDAPNATVADAEDLAGEIANLVVGRAKAYFSLCDLGFELGTPILLTGKNVSLRYRASRPALVLELSNDDSSLLMSFCFDTYETDRFEEPSAEKLERVIGAGELVFL